MWSVDITQKALLSLYMENKVFPLKSCIGLYKRYIGCIRGYTVKDSRVIRYHLIEGISERY